MTFDPQFYNDFVEWTKRKGGTLARTKPEQLPLFISELANILNGVFAMIKDFAKAIGGGFLGAAVGLAAWTKANPDPLKVTRVAIRAMYLKWGES